MISKLIKKWNELGAPVKSAIAFTFSSLLIRGIAFLTTPIFTRIMDSTQYGIISKYNSWNTILEVFALLGLTSAGVFNTGLNDYKEKRDKFISTMLILCNISTLVVYIAVILIQIIIGREIILPYTLINIMFVQFVFQPAQIFWITRERYEYRYKIATIVSVFSTILSQLFAIWFIKCRYFESDSISKIMGTAIGSLTFCIPIYIMLMKKGKTFIDKQIWKQVLIFAIPLIPHYLAQHVMASADRIMISDMYSSSAAAIYSVVSAISLIATVIWSAINASLVPYTYESLNKNEYTGIKKISLGLLIAYAVLCLGVSLIAPEVLFILAPKEYYSGIYAVPPIAAVAFFNALYNLYATIEFYHKKSKGIAIATIISCIINIFLNAIFIPRFGFVAAAYTTLVSNIVLVLMHYLFYRNCQNDRVYNDRFIVIITIITIVFCELCNVLYINVFIRYSCIVFILIITLIKYKDILKMINSLKNK